MNKYLADAVVPSDVPAVDDLVKSGDAHTRDTPGGRVYVVHDSGHRLLGSILRERGRVQSIEAAAHVRVTDVTDVTGPRGKKWGT